MPNVPACACLLMYFILVLQIPIATNDDASALADIQSIPENLRSQFAKGEAFEDNCTVLIESYKSARVNFIKQLMDPLLAQYDFLAMPTLPFFPQLITNSQLEFSPTYLAAYAGFPSINIPVGFSGPMVKSNCCVDYT